MPEDGPESEADERGRLARRRRQRSSAWGVSDAYLPGDERVRKPAKPPWGESDTDAGARMVEEGEVTGNRHFLRSIEQIQADLEIMHQRRIRADHARELLEEYDEE